MLPHDVIEEFRLGMIEHKAWQALPKLRNSPYLDRPHVTYAEYLEHKGVAGSASMTGAA